MTANHISEQLGDIRQHLEQLGYYATKQNPPVESVDRTADVFKEDIIEMVQLVDFTIPNTTLSRKRHIGPLITLVKKVMIKLTAPFVRIIFTKQIRLNYLMVMMAQRVLALEERVAALEGKTKQ